MEKDYKYENIEKIFKKNLENYKKYFGIVSFFGSLNLERDLDLFILPKKNVKKGEFLINLILFLEDISFELSEIDIDMMVIWHSTYEEEAIKICEKKKVLIIHVSSFPDIHPFIIPNYLNILKKSKNVLLGSWKLIEEIKKTKLDYFYNYLFISNCLLANYPKDFERKKILTKTNFIYKHLNGKSEEVSNNNEAKNIFFNCCNFLDKLAY